MKKLLLTLIVTFALGGSIFAQDENWNPLGLESHWPEFYNGPYDFGGAIVASITIDGEIIYQEDPRLYYLEVASFIVGTDECRGNLYFLDDTYVIDWGDPYPILNGNPIYYNNTGETVYFMMYDHLNGIEYGPCDITLEGEPFVVLTGDDNMQGWWDPEQPIFLNFSLPNISASVSPEEGGIVSGTGIYLDGEICTLTATANPGYYFLNWTENDSIVSSETEYSFAVTESRNLVANFYTNHWTAESYQNDMFMVGVVQIDSIEQTSPTLELGAFCNDECRGTIFPVYEEGRWLYYLTIGGNNGDDISFRLYDHALQRELNLYCFSEFPFEYYGLIGIEEPYEVVFARMFNVSVIVNPEDAGTVTGEGTYLNGTEVVLTASANENSIFIGWTIGDEQVSIDTVYSFIVTEDLTLVANFSSGYKVTVSANPAEGGSVSGAGIYVYGTNCTLVATANAGYAFNNWSIDGEIVSTEPSYTFTVTAPVNALANFDVLCPISAIVSPEDAGTITGVGEYVLGTVATLTATANDGYLFNSWTLDGEIVSTEPSYTFTVTAPVNLTANFDILYSVSIDVNLEYAGIITGAGEYVSGTNVTLTATGNEGYVFSNWTLDGEIVSTEPSYTFMVTESVNLIANFYVVCTQQLSAGWNWLSTDVEITLDDLKGALMVALPGTIITIKSRMQNAAYNPNNNRWKGTLVSLDVAQMYMIWVDTDCEVTLIGNPVNPTEHSITIHEGSNWIAFPLRESMPINDALAGFPAVSGDIIKSRSNNAIYLRGQWRGAVTALETGQGYIFISNAQEDRILTFPESTR